MALLSYGITVRQIDNHLVLFAGNQLLRFRHVVNHLRSHDSAATRQKRNRETRDITEHKLESEKHREGNQIPLIRLHHIIDDSVEEEHHRYDKCRNKRPQKLAPQRLLVRPQIIARKIVNQQTDQRIDNQRWPETEGRDNSILHKLHTTVIHNPTKGKETNPYQFGTEKVSDYIQVLLFASGSHGCLGSNDAECAIGVNFDDRTRFMRALVLSSEEAAVV